LTPRYYLSEEDAEFRKEVDRFISFALKIPFQHPLRDAEGNSPEYFTPVFGIFGAGKGPTKTQSHHPAIDFKVGVRETIVNIYAAHDGIVHVYRNAPKYRHYVSVTTDVKDDFGFVLGEMVSIYGHVDLDLDSAQNVLPDGKHVKRGEIISKNLWSGTRGGPHLHFEIRYYRPEDMGIEEFYGFKRPNGSGFSQASAGDWEYGFWNPGVGYGYGYPENHWDNAGH
jgi:murein DD-endopeptidase MepM/ murein hydrolase activator NlpD